MKGTQSKLFLNAIVPLAILLGGCLSEESSFHGRENAAPGDTNSAPIISGTPLRRARISEPYFFKPSANDPDGDNLTFAINKRPDWLSFDKSSGRLSGTPSLADVGTHNSISITVTDGAMSATLGPFSIEVEPDSTPNSAPSISGSPASEATVGSMYSFAPAANDADGDTLAFSVSGLPSWATFDDSSGRLSGTPDDADVGTYSNIRISVSDGVADVSLAPFSITVQAISLGSVTLDWTAPTANEDGTALTDLAGYKLYWGTDPGVYTSSVTIDNPSVTTYVVDNLASGEYEFVATSFNASGIESQYSDPTTKVVR